MLFFTFSGDPLYVGFDLTIASFDSISEVSMVSNTREGDSTLKQEQNFFDELPFHKLFKIELLQIKSESSKDSLDCSVKKY